MITTGSQDSYGHWKKLLFPAEGTADPKMTTVQVEMACHHLTLHLSMPSACLEGETFASPVGSVTGVIAAEHWSLHSPTCPARFHTCSYQNSPTGGVPGVKTLTKIRGILRNMTLCPRKVRKLDFLATLLAPGSYGNICRQWRGLKEQRDRGVTWKGHLSSFSHI